MGWYHRGHEVAGFLIYDKEIGVYEGHAFSLQRTIWGGCSIQPFFARFLEIGVYESHTTLRRSEMMCGAQGAHILANI